MCEASKFNSQNYTHTHKEINLKNLTYFGVFKYMNCANIGTCIDNQSAIGNS